MMYRHRYGTVEWVVLVAVSPALSVAMKVKV
jgi:hypothetical protein